MSVFSGNNAGVGCMVLFGLPFAGVGVFMLFLLGWSAYDFARMRSWKETPATILAVDLEHGDDTQQVVADYEYEYEGQKYAGSRVAINSMSDNLGDFHSRKFKELNAHRADKKPFRCFVNPSSPGESILYRQLRWELLSMFMLFGLVFGGVGFGIIFAAFVAGRVAKDRSAREFDRPDEPWLWREDWAAGYVASDDKTTTIILIAMTGLWNLISWPISLLVLPSELAHGNYWVLIICAFPLIGLFLIYGSALAILRWRKYGQSRLQLASNPGVIGGSLAGAVIAKNVDNASEFHQTLTCQRTKSDGDGDKTKEVLWQTARVIDKKMPTGELDTAAIPVLFHIPYDCRPTTLDDDDDDISWALEVKAEAPGVDYKSTFEVPIFRTADSSPDHEGDDALIAEYVKDESPDTVYSRAKVSRQLFGGQLHIRFGFGRNMAACLALAAFAVVWNVVIVVMVTAGAPILFAAVFVLADLLILYFLAELTFWTSDFVVDANGLQGKFGVFKRTREWKASEIRGVRSKKGMQSGNSVYYDIKLQLDGGKDYTIGKSIEGVQNADHIAEDISRALKLADK